MAIDGHYRKTSESSEAVFRVQIYYDRVHGTIARCAYLLRTRRRSQTSRSPPPRGGGSGYELVHKYIYFHSGMDLILPFDHHRVNVLTEAKLKTSLHPATLRSTGESSVRTATYCTRVCILYDRALRTQKYVQMICTVGIRYCIKNKVKENIDVYILSPFVFLLPSTRPTMHD